MLLLSLLLVAAPTDAERLAAGDVLVNTSVQDTVTVTAVIDAPPETVWPIVIDCANYKTTMPSIVDSVRLSYEGDTMVCKVTADVPFPFSDLVSVTRAKMTVTPDRWERKWTLVEGDYHRNEGMWLLERYGADGKKTLARYSISAKPKISLPEAIVKRAQESKMPEMMLNIRKKAAAKSAR